VTAKENWQSSEAEYALKVIFNNNKLISGTKIILFLCFANDSSK